MVMMVVVILVGRSKRFLPGRNLRMLDGMTHAHVLPRPCRGMLGKIHLTKRKRQSTDSDDLQSINNLSLVPCQVKTALQGLYSVQHFQNCTQASGEPHTGSKELHADSRDSHLQCLLARVMNQMVQSMCRRTGLLLGE